MGIFFSMLAIHKHIYEQPLFVCFLRYSVLLQAVGMNGSLVVPPCVRGFAEVKACVILAHVVHHNSSTAFTPLHPVFPFISRASFWKACELEVCKFK